MYVPSEIIKLIQACKTTEEAEIALTNYKDTVAFYWHIEDVLDLAHDACITITKKQAQDILASVKTNHDPWADMSFNIICELQEYS